MPSRTALVPPPTHPARGSNARPPRGGGRAGVGGLGGGRFARGAHLAELEAALLSEASHGRLEGSRGPLAAVAVQERREGAQRVLGRVRLHVLAGLVVDGQRPRRHDELGRLPARARARARALQGRREAGPWAMGRREASRRCRLMARRSGMTLRKREIMNAGHAGKRHHLYSTSVLARGLSMSTAMAILSLKGSTSGKSLSTRASRRSGSHWRM